MTDPIDATIILAMTLCAGGIARVLLNERRERKRLEKDNAALAEALNAATAELGQVRDERDEEIAKNYELTLEIEAYRDERGGDEERSALH